MPRKKPRRTGPEATADPVPLAPPAPAVPPPGEPAAKPPFQYQFEKDQAAKPTLTAREEEIVGYVAKGKENLEIALQLGTGERTIEKHMKNIRAKFGAKTRTAIVARYYEEKIEELEMRIEVLAARVRELGG